VLTPEQRSVIDKLPPEKANAALEESYTNASKRNAQRDAGRNFNDLFFPGERDPARAIDKDFLRWRRASKRDLPRKRKKRDGALWKWGLTNLTGIPVGGQVY